MLKPTYFLLFFLFVAGCSSDDGSKEFVFENIDLQGQIGGNDWSYVDGRAQEFSNWDSLRLELYPVAFEQPCPFTTTVDFEKVAFHIPQQIGLINFSNPNSVFYIQGPSRTRILDNSVVDGALEILSINESMITGRITASVDSETNLNGNFSVNRCDQFGGYYFNDQNAKGLIDGEEWIFVDGLSIDEPNLNQGSFRIELRIEEIVNHCQRGFKEDLNYVEFIVPMASGIYTLISGSMATFVHAHEGRSSYLIGGGGAIEITSIQETVISGRVDVRALNGSYINGNFTVDRCSE